MKKPEWIATPYHFVMQLAMTENALRSQITGNDLLACDDGK
jgi:hypothetical protein